MSRTLQTAMPIPRAGPSARAMARTVLGLFKLRIGMLIMLTALVGAAITPGPALGPARYVVLALSVLVASASAGAFNQYHERGSDGLMARTRQRAFVTGALRASPAWLLLAAAMLAAAVAAAWLVLNPASAAFVFLGAFFYAIVYTVWLKRRTRWNIVVGGLAGSFAVLAGGCAVAPVPSALPLLLALVLFLWTPPHFWALAIACRDDYRAAGIPMLPVVAGNAVAARAVLASTVALLLVSLLPMVYGAGPVYGVGALAGGSLFVVRAAALVRTPDDRRAAKTCFFASLVQLSVLLLAATLDVMAG